MTQAELDAIPETGTFGCRLEERNGQTVRIPVLFDVGVLYVGSDNDPVSVTDEKGNTWMIGLASDGKRYKRHFGQRFI